MGLLSQKFSLWQDTLTNGIIKVNAVTRETTFNIVCSDDLSKLLISYDEGQSWSLVQNFNCQNKTATIQYTLPANIVDRNGASLNLPSIPFLMKSTGESLASIEINGRFVVPVFDNAHLFISLENGSSITSQSVISANLNAEQVIDSQRYLPSSYYLTSVSGCVTSGQWLPFSNLVLNLNIDQLNSSNTFYVKFKDSVGNESSCVQQSITHDNTGPSLQSISLNDNAAQTVSNTVLLKINATDAPTMMKINQSLDCTGLSSWVAYSTTQNINLTTSGVVPVSVILKDSIGNLSNCVSTSIVFDSSPPQVPQSLTFLNGVSSPGRQSQIDILVNPVFAGNTAVLYSDASCSTPVASATAPIGGGATVKVQLNTNGSYNYYAKVYNPNVTYSSCSSAFIHYEYDTVAPVVTSVTSTLNSGDYTTGQVIPIQVTFSKNVSVSGTPLLGLNLSAGVSTTAQYVSGSGSTHLLFNYTVTSSDVSSGLDSTGFVYVDNSSSISDLAGNSAELLVPTGVATIGSLLNSKTLRVNDNIQISSVTKPIIGIFNPGREIDFIVNWSGAVTITGNPQLYVDIGGVQHTASYISSRSKAKNTVFSISSWSSSASSGVTVKSINLNGGTIKNTTTLTSATLSTINQNFSDVRLYNLTVTTVGFATADAEVFNETSGTVNVALSLNQAAPVDMNIEYFVQNHDKNISALISNKYGFVQIPAGQTSVFLTLPLTANPQITGVTGFTISLIGTDYGQIRSINQTKEVYIRDLEMSSPVVEIATSGNHRCYRTQVGELFCAGSNTYGEVGNGTTSNTGLVKIFSGDVSQVAVSPMHSCAVVLSELYCWGRNNYGQIGIGSTLSQLSPVKVASLAGVTAVALGYTHTCAIHDNANQKLSCWGANSSGQLGDGTTVQKKLPVTIISNSVTKIALGSAHSCAIVGSDLKCWGSNSYGQLGIGSTISQMTPQIVSNNSGVAISSLAATTWGTCIIASNSDLLCWGKTNSLGINAASNVLSMPTSSARTGTGYLVLIQGASANSSSYSGQLAIKNDGSLAYWNAAVPALASISSTTVVGFDSSSIAGGKFNYVGADGLVRSSQTDSVNSLGNTSTSLSPVNFDFMKINKIKSASYSPNQNCFINILYQVYCNGTYVGDGQSAARANSFTRILQGEFINVDIGENGGCGIRNDNTLWCWGSTSITGDGQTHYNPVYVMSDVQSMAVGYQHVCALKNDKTVYCWGNGYGVGNGNTSGLVSQPTQIVMTNSGSTLKSVVSLAAGYNYTCAVVQSGQLYCWGENTNGQLGNINTGVNVSWPTEVFLIEPKPSFVKVSVGYAHTCALASDLTTRCWGYNYYGQIGRGSAASSIPFDLGAIKTSVTDLSIGAYSSMALDMNQNLYAWGSNPGHSAATALSPVLIKSSLSAAAKIWSGSTNCYQDGNTSYLNCWGNKNPFWTNWPTQTNSPLIGY